MDADVRTGPPFPDFSVPFVAFCKIDRPSAFSFSGSSSVFEFSALFAVNWDLDVLRLVSPRFLGIWDFELCLGRCV